MGSTTLPSDYEFALSEVFVLLFVTLGPPLKVPALFLSTTCHLDEGVAKALASRAFLFAVAAALIGGFIGVSLMQKWHVSDAALQLAAGIVFFLVSLRSVLGEYDKGDSGTAPRGADARTPTAFGIAVPMLVTPYGLAAIILLIAHSQDTTRLVSIAALVLVVMFLNLLAMRYARR